MIRASRAPLACLGFVACVAALSACSPAAPAGSALPTPSRTPILLGPTSTSTTAPTPLPTRPPTPTPAPLPSIDADDWRLGADTAPVRFLVYSDFQSTNGALGLADLLATFDRHPEDVQIVFRHLPVLPQYDKDSLAGQAAEAAGRQGRFWDMVRLLVSAYPEWSVLPPESFRDWLDEKAVALGLDPDDFAADLDGGRYAPLMVEAFQEATDLGLPGVPTILMNGTPFRLSPTPLSFESAVRLELLADRQYAAPPPLTIDPAQGYTAFLELATGDIVVQLMPQAAPLAVNSFVFLASEGWFDGMEIHLVEPGILVEAGDPSGTGFGDPGYHLPDEIDPGLTFGAPGVVAMSSEGPGTGGSRFFITLQPLPSLDGSRTIFGRVVEGLDLLASLPARDPGLDLLSPTAAIVRRVRVIVTE